jgi:hypothetical protein
MAVCWIKLGGIKTQLFEVILKQNTSILLADFKKKLLMLSCCPNYRRNVLFCFQPSRSRLKCGHAILHELLVFIEQPPNRVAWTFAFCISMVFYFQKNTSILFVAARRPFGTRSIEGLGQ